MPNKLPGRESICRRLAEKLDEAWLAQMFPEYEPAAILSVLRGTKGNSSKTLAASDAPGVPAGWCQLFTDGASRGNPGPAGAGALLLAADGGELQRISTYLGLCTNNAAEYKALIAGLKEALRQGCGRLSLCMDSELIVRQLEGRYKVRHEQLLPLYQEAKTLLARFDAWQVRHVPRTQNQTADALANAGIDQYQAGQPNI